jgi:hypothetical protein
MALTDIIALGVTFLIGWRAAGLARSPEGQRCPVMRTVTPYVMTPIEKSIHDAIRGIWRR